MGKISQAQIEMMDEENQKFWRQVRESEKMYCDNVRGTKLGCTNCRFYQTSRCARPEVSFSM